MKPDLIVSWPSNCDYPLWRNYIRHNRDRFNLVIIVFTETNDKHDYRKFVRMFMSKDYVLFIDNPPIKAGEDWRNVAVNQALIQSYNAEWVWFTEQDFIIKKGFWEEVDEIRKTDLPVIGAFQEGRLHPCCIFMKRKVLDVLKKDFSAKPPHYDHFGYIQLQLDQLQIPQAILPFDTFQHLNGLSHNWRLVADGGEPNYHPEEFKDWIIKSLEVDVPLDPNWKKTAENYIKSVKNSKN